MSNASATRTINANKKDIWAKLADFGNIGDWSSGVVSSNWESDTRHGVGMERHCDLGKGKFLKERVIKCTNQSEMVIDFFDHNMPLKSGQATFSLGKKEKQGVPVTFSVDYQLKFGPVGALLDKVMVRKEYSRVANQMLTDLEASLA